MRSSLRLPEDFRRALRRHGLEDFFLSCVQVHRAGYLSWRAQTRRTECRREKILQAMARLAAQREAVFDAAGLGLLR